LNGYSVTPISVNHTVPAVGYLVEGKKDKRFFYTGDTGPTALTWKKIKNKKINCLIIDVSFPNKMSSLAIKTGHLTPDLLRKEILQISPMPELICITHPKPQYFSTIKRELQQLKLKSLKILKDGDIIRI
jgi:ribonuclease BN (tRNA processing enzyme)